MDEEVKIDIVAIYLENLTFLSGGLYITILIFRPPTFVVARAKFELVNLSTHIGPKLYLQLVELLPSGGTSAKIRGNSPFNPRYKTCIKNQHII